MVHPEPSQSLNPASVLARLEAVEGAVQEVRFQHMVKVDAATNGLGILYGQLQRVKQELTGFRAEVTAHLAAQDTKLDEILRRLPPPANEQA